MANLQEIVIFAVVVTVMVVFVVLFYYRGEEIMDHIEEGNPFIWTANKLRLDTCFLPFSNQSGKCMDPDFCDYVELPKYEPQVLKCKYFTDFICCPNNASVLE